MAAVEIIAWIVVIASLIKILILWYKPRAWMSFSKRILSQPNTVKVVGFVISLIILFYLLQEISIVQVMAVVAFTAILLLVGLASDVPSLLKKYEAQIKKGTLWRDYWFYVLLWLILIVWTVRELVA